MSKQQKKTISLEEWQEQLGHKVEVLPIKEAMDPAFFGREVELAELQTFLDNPDARIFGLYGVQMIGKTSLTNEFLNKVEGYETARIKFQNPENPETTLDDAQKQIDWHNQKPKLIVIENFEEALQWKGGQDHLHEIRFEKISQFLQHLKSLPFVKVILESRFQIKLNFLHPTAYKHLSSIQLGRIDREILYQNLNAQYRNNTVSFTDFEALCDKLNDHVWLVALAMQSDWQFEDIREATRNPQSITQQLWEKLERIIRRLTSAEKTLLCAFTLRNPIAETDLERETSQLLTFKKTGELSDALWSLRKKLLTTYQVNTEQYEINPFLREVCFTFLRNQKEMRTIENLPFFQHSLKPRYDEILQALEKGDYGTFFRLLKEKRKARKYEEVVDILHEAYWNDSKKEVILNEIGITYKWQKKWEDAKKYFEQAAELGNIPSYNELAIVYKEQGNYEEAIQLLKRAVDLGNIHSHNELAIVYKEQKDYEEAIRILKKALKINDKDVKTLNELAIVYKEQGDYEEAIRVLEKALHIQPNNVWILNELAMVYKEQRDYAAAIPLLEKAINLGNLPSYNQLAIIFREQNNFEKSLNLSQQAIKINVRNVPTYLALAETYLHFGKLIEADNAIKDGLEKCGKDKYLLILQNRILKTIKDSKLLNQNNEMDYKKLNQTKESNIEIPQFFITEMTRQFEDEYRKMQRYNKLLSDMTDKVMRQDYEKEVDLCDENIARIEQRYFKKVKESRPQLSEVVIRRMIEDLKNTISRRFDKVDADLHKVLFSIEEIGASINVQEIEANPDDKAKAEELLQFIKERLDKMDIPNKREIGENLNGELSAGGKLKLVIKLGILQYEQDLLAFTAKEPVKHWKDLWKAFFKKKEDTNKG